MAGSADIQIAARLDIDVLALCDVDEVGAEGEVVAFCRGDGDFQFIGHVGWRTVHLLLDAVGSLRLADLTGLDVDRDIATFDVGVLDHRRSVSAARNQGARDAILEIDGAPGIARCRSRNRFGLIDLDRASLGWRHDLAVLLVSGDDDLGRGVRRILHRLTADHAVHGIIGCGLLSFESGDIGG